MTPGPVAVVLAAGKGVRTGGDIPKQLRLLGGVPVMAHAIDQHLRLGHEVILVVSAAVRTEAMSLAAAHDGEPITVVDGGETRRESVLAGIAAIPDGLPADRAVILRNAASPNTPDEVIDACVAGLADHDGMQAYVASDATTFIHDGTRLHTLVPRAETGFTCDPTVYRRGLVDAIAAQMEGGADGETTLDIARRLDASVGIVESPPGNIKITTSDDFDRVASAMGISSP